MTDSGNEDSVTKLNTQLNKSMVLMEDAVDIPSQNHKRKSITINTKTQSSSTTSSPATKSRKSTSATNSPVKSRKSILKKSDKSFSDDSANSGIAQNDNAEEFSNVTPQKLSSVSVSSRPSTLEELIQKETLSIENISSTFNLEDISDSEDIWIMDLPKLVNPQELCGQMIALEDKSKFKVKDERYCIVAHKTNHNVTCVFNIEKDTSQYKTVNVKPAGVLTVRRKLSGTPEIKPIPIAKSGMEFPDNLKTRHPLLGVIPERKRRSKKHSSLKANQE